MMSRYLYYKERKVNKKMYFTLKKKKSVKYYRREIYVFVYLYDRLCVLKNVKNTWKKFFCKKFFLIFLHFIHIRTHAHTIIF